MIIPKEVRQKPAEYIILGIIFLFTLILYFVLPQQSSRRIIVYCMAGSYFLWSLIHHYFRGDLTLSIVIEYLVMALFGVALLTLSFF
jgi:hypothetical protein